MPRLGFGIKIIGLKKLKKFSKKPVKNRKEIARTIQPAIIEAIKTGKLVAQAEAPVKTGHLRRNIKGESKRVSSGNLSVLGRIFINLDIVPYARRQNFEHATKRFFLEKGGKAASDRLSELLNKKEIAEKLVSKT